MLGPIPVADKLIANKNTAGEIAHGRDTVGWTTVPFQLHATTYNNISRKPNYGTACAESKTSKILKIHAWSLQLSGVVIFGGVCSHRAGPRETNAQIRAYYNRGTKIQPRDSHFFSPLPSSSSNCFNNHSHVKKVESSRIDKIQSINCMQH